MKTKHNFWKWDKYSKLHGIFAKLECNLIYVLLIAVTLFGCSSDDPDPRPVGEIELGGTINGIVVDQDGNRYPGVAVEISNGDETLNRSTDTEGKFTAVTRGIGFYEISVKPPLSTTLTNNSELVVEVLNDKTYNLNINIEAKPVTVTLNFGNADIFNEIRDANGNSPVSPDEPLFAANFFADPIGKLTAIKKPNGEPVVLDEWKMANGDLYVQCNGNKSAVTVSLEGLIPNGTYTFWLAFLNKDKQVGQPVGPADFVYQVNPPLNSGSGNVKIADSNGNIEVLIEHNSCILTDEVALVIPIIYHLNGNTFGAGVIPDEEEVSHLLAYFQ